MFQPPPGLPADPQTALKQMQSQVSGFAAGGGGGMMLPNGQMMGGGAPQDFHGATPGAEAQASSPNPGGGAPLPLIGSNPTQEQPWIPPMTAGGRSPGAPATSPHGGGQPPLPPAVQAEVDAGRMDPAGARARVMANRPGFGGGQSPPIIAKPAQMPGKGPNVRGGGLASGRPNPDLGNLNPGGPFVGGGDLVPGMKGGGGGGTLSVGGRSPGVPTFKPFVPHEAPIPAPGPGGPNGLTAMSSPSFSALPGGDPSQGGQDQQPPLLPNGLPQAGINPAYQRQMMGAMRGMFQ